MVQRQPLPRLKLRRTPHPLLRKRLPPPPRPRPWKLRRLRRSTGTLDRRWALLPRETQSKPIPCSARRRPLTPDRRTDSASAETACSMSMARRRLIRLAVRCLAALTYSCKTRRGTRCLTATVKRCSRRPHPGLLHRLHGNDSAIYGTAITPRVLHGRGGAVGGYKTGFLPQNAPRAKDFPNEFK